MFKMAKVENDIDIYYLVGNANTQRQENEITSIIKKRHSTEFQLISKSSAIVDPKQVLKYFIHFEKEIVNNTVDIYTFSQEVIQIRKIFTR